MLNCFVVFNQYLGKWQFGKMGVWENGSLGKWQFGKISFCGAFYSPVVTAVFMYRLVYVPPGLTLKIFSVLPTQCIFVFVWI
jgi:hypothetical protein